MRASWLVGLLVVVAASPLANAYITGISCAADGDGAVACQSSWAYTNAEKTEATMNLTEAMYRSPAHVLGDVSTSDSLDPTVWVLKTVENASGSTWTGYHFNIFMDQSFNIGGVVAPTGWTYVVTPASAGSFTDNEVPTPRTWGFWGAVDFVSTGSTYDIAPLSSGDFGAKLSFLGPVQFEVEQMYVVPEPISMALLALGGLFLRRRS